MALYQYHCTHCKTTQMVRHGMDEVDRPHHCPDCHGVLRRVLTPIHHRWPSHHHPVYGEGGQRRFLDPERQARLKDKLARMKEGRNGSSE